MAVKNYDLYISFAGTGDNVPEQTRLWVPEFKHFLAISLSRILKTSPKVIDSSDFNSGELKGKDKREIFEQTKTFVIVLSKEFLADKAAMEEFKLIHMLEKSHLFKVVLNNISPSEQLPALRDLNAYNFFSRNEKDGTVEEYNQVVGSANENQFWFQLVGLGYDIAKRINPNLHQGVAGIEQKTVYLAETGVDQMLNRDIIKRELQLHGYYIVPDHPLSDELHALEKEIQNFLDRSAMSIHVIGEEKGRVLQGSEKSIVEIQNELASQYYNAQDPQADQAKDFSRVIWISPKVSRSGKKDRFDVEDLKRNPAALHGAEILETPIEVTKTIIRNKINGTMRADFATNFIDNELKTRVYLIFERSQAEKVQPIKEFLEGNNIQVFIPEFENSKNLIQIHRRNLTYCHGTIVYYANNYSHWLDAKLKDIMKSPGFGRTFPMKGNVVLVEKGCKATKYAEERNDVLIVEDVVEFNSDTLKPFLAKLK